MPILSDLQYPALEQQGGGGTNHHQMPSKQPKGGGSSTSHHASSTSRPRKLSPVRIRNDGNNIKVTDYGYGQGSPDTAKVNNRIIGNVVTTTAESVTDEARYGYESGFSPDVAKKKQQGQELSPQPLPLHTRQQQAAAPFKTHHTYDGTRVPRRSSLKSSSSLHSPKNTHFSTGRPDADHSQTDPSSSSGGGKPTRGLRRYSSYRNPPVTTTMVEVRMRGERNPVQRCRSIDFSKTVQVKEVQPISQLNEDVRELWLQADDFAAMKEHRRSLLKRYKEREAAGQTIHSASYNHTSAMSAMAGYGSGGYAHNNNNNTDHHNQHHQQHHTNSQGGTYPTQIATASSSSDTATASGRAGTSSKETMSRMMSSSSEEENDSFRGLEKYIDKSGRRQKNMAWDTVLLEQDTQEVSGHFDDERIAELYRIQTQESPEKALVRAAQDRAAVEEYLMSPRTTKLMQRTRLQAMRRLSC